MSGQKFEPSFADKTDFVNANRGLIDSLKPCIIKAADGRVVWNNDEYDFLKAECPDTANPKLWRQSQLTSIQGLFEVTPGIYQVRGFDLSNMTIVEGEEGVIVIDPLTAVESAAAALALYRKNRGNRKVTGIIYSHSHIDHYGGAKGILPDGTEEVTPVIAPEGFMDEATSENLYAGGAMSRRAAHMYGTRLPKAADGQIGCGIGMGVSGGIRSLIPPNVTISETGDERFIDGVHMIFQMVPEAEAPSEMNFYFPQHQALYIAECATHNLHNIITLRGAQVRDAKAWSGYLDESLVLFGHQSDVLLAGHNWPTWDQKKIIDMISEQRDLYAYLHDQTMRMMNRGMTGIEIAEEITLPPSLQKLWHTQGFYGSVSHNVKGIYQRYMGWFDGNAAHLWEYPPKENAKRYVACMGGIDEVIRKAGEFEAEGDLRFATTLLGHAVSLDPSHKQAKASLASVFRKLGYGAENSTWRNFYLSEASALLATKKPHVGRPLANQLKPMQSIDQWLTLLSISLDGLKAGDECFAIKFYVKDSRQWWRINLSNGSLTYRNATSKDELQEESNLTLELNTNELLDALTGGDQQDKVHAGDWSLIPKLLSLIET
ncbi:Metallo-hydrolase/oxidoreductase [Penicillium angulare]|uniref:Metallo-hydrolase/oxidoreductase n=1 Tax=Penicillium angulare TaxID=116970 RepID=UPI00253FD527|nr:Metallo-hydrolase/oxidoreductase [Penicillium angulare]KAJ5281848.1 Metallo-hydrolase/oxidoreductase [Penicillium angulare]